MVNSTGVVVYRRGRFFALEMRLTDGSTVHDVCANDTAGDPFTLTHAETESQALNIVDALFDALTRAGSE